MACLHNAIVERIGCKQTQLNLYGCDGMHGVSFANGTRVDLGQANTANLALFYQLSQGFDRSLNGRAGIDTG